MTNIRKCFMMIKNVIEVYINNVCENINTFHDRLEKEKEIRLRLLDIQLGKELSELELMEVYEWLGLERTEAHETVERQLRKRRKAILKGNKND